jgi:hypothetical protein
MSLDGKIKYIIYSTRWPQRNAKQIREAGVRLTVFGSAVGNECGESRTLLHREELNEIHTLYYELSNLVLGKDLTEYRKGLMDIKQKEIQARKQSRDRSETP